MFLTALDRWPVSGILPRTTVIQLRLPGVCGGEEESPHVDSDRLAVGVEREQSNTKFLAINCDFSRALLPLLQTLTLMSFLLFKAKAVGRDQSHWAQNVVSQARRPEATLLEMNLEG